MQGNRGTTGQKQWYEHVPRSLETSQGGKVTILWNQQVQTGRTIPSNKPDIIILINEKGTCMLIDVAISGCLLDLFLKILEHIHTIVFVQLYPCFLAYFEV